MIFSRVSLADWFKTVFCIFICSFPDMITAFENLSYFYSFVLVMSSWVFTRLPIVSTRFYWFSSCFYSISSHLPIVSTRVSFCLLLTFKKKAKKKKKKNELSFNQILIQIGNFRINVWVPLASLVGIRDADFIVWSLDL